MPEGIGGGKQRPVYGRIRLAMSDLKKDLLPIKRASYESLIFPTEERDRFLGDLIESVKKMSPNGEGLYPGRLHQDSPAPHHSLSVWPHYADNQTGRVAQAEAVAFETYWQENDIIEGRLFNDKIGRYDISDFKRIFKIGSLVNNEKVSIIVWAAQKGMDWFYKELLAATFVREVMLGEISFLIDLYKNDLFDKKSFIYPRMELFKPVLDKDQLIIGRNVAAAAAAFGYDWIKQYIRPDYAWQDRYRKQWNKPLKQGFDMGVKLYSQVLDYAVREGLMTKFKTGRGGEVSKSPALLK